ncbi:MAG: YggS family pyridoxal phosphate-dependent enzyme [Bacteroidota bacterium]
MGSISESYKKIKNHLPPHVRLVAVSKTRPTSDIMELYECGHRVFGESKAQEMVPKQEQLPADIQWHMIGHLQTNKVKYIAPFVSMIHSVDSLKLLKTINKEAAKNNRVIDCLLQMHIAEEETKFGLDYNELTEMLSSEAFQKMKNVRIRGLMCMATFTDDHEQVRREFRQLTSYFHKARETFFADDNTFSERSMGMSDDYQVAVEEGSTMVRIGSILFGSR